MKLLNACDAHRLHLWHITMYPANNPKAESAGGILSLHGVRILALLVTTALWVGLTLSTGFFTVAMVVLIGASIGVAHRVLPATLHCPHLPSALVFVVVGGLFANVMAGLALFSTRFGVDYSQVLMAREFPQDFSLLWETFKDSFRIQDLLYYMGSLLALVGFSRRNVHRRRPLKGESSR